MPTNHLDRLHRDIEALALQEEAQGQLKGGAVLEEDPVTTEEKPNGMPSSRGTADLPCNDSGVTGQSPCEDFSCSCLTLETPKG